MNADGSVQTRLTSNTARDGGPAWSADGRLIAFETNRDDMGLVEDRAEVYSMNANGSNQRNLTNNLGDDNMPGPGDLEPYFSPDSLSIVFRSDRNSPGPGLYTIPAGGGSGQMILNEPNATRPAWSPDGQKVAYTTFDGVDLEVFAASSTGGSPTNLTNDPGIDGGPNWSPDGTKIAFETSRDGNNEIYVMNANGTNQVNVSMSPGTQDTAPAWSPDGRRIAFQKGDEVWVMDANGANATMLAAGGEPDWQPLPDCADIQVGFATAQGCFKETSAGSGIFETDQQAWVGGFEIKPRPGGKLRIDTNPTPSVSESGAGVDVVFAGFNVPVPVSLLPVSVPDGSFDLNQPGTVEKILLDLPLKATVKVAWADGGRAAAFEGDLEIEDLTDTLGGVVPMGEAPGGIGTTGGKLKARLENGRGFVLDQAEIKIDELNVVPRRLRTARTLSLRNLLLRFELRNGRPFWTGQAGIRLPLTRGALDVTGTAFVFDKELAGGGLAVDGINQRVGNLPIFLQRVSGNLLFAPDFGFDLTVGGSLGPRVNGKDLLTLEGVMQGGQFAAADCTTGADPSKLTISSKLTPLEPLELAGLAEAEMSFRSCFFTGNTAAMELTGQVKLSFANEALAYEATQTGFVSSTGANLEGSAVLKLPGLPDLNGQSIISTRGVAACTNLVFFQGGFAYRFGQAGGASTFSGCDLSPFRVTVSAAGSRAAAATRLRLPAGLPHAAFSARGASGPPRLRVRGPGFSVTTGRRAVRNRRVVIVPAAHERTTYVIVNDPRAGAWTVEPAVRGQRITRVRAARGLAKPRIRVRVRRRGTRMRLTYNVRRIPGQQVTFIERANGIARTIGRARRARGTITFIPTPGGRRTIEADVIQDRLPRASPTVARFTAPAR